MTHYHTPEGVRMSPYDALIQALNVPPHCDPVEWAGALAAHCSRLSVSRDGLVGLGAMDTAKAVVALREPPEPVPTGPGLWYSRCGRPVEVQPDGGAGSRVPLAFWLDDDWEAVTNAYWLPDPADPTKALRCPTAEEWLAVRSKT